MTSLVKTNIKLTAIITIFMVILSLGSMMFLDYNLSKNIEMTCEEHYESLVHNIEGDFEGLFISTEKIAHNKEIIEVLNTNNSFSELDNSEILVMNERINVYEGFLQALSFVDTINIASVKGNYLFSKGTITGDFDVSERPWFKEEFLYDENETQLASIHKDFNTGKDVLSIISFIKSENDGTLLGIVILDVFIDDLLEAMTNSFQIGNVNSYLRLSDGNYYGKDGIVEDFDKKKEGIFSVNNSCYNKDSDGLELLVEYDIKSITYSESFKKFKDFQALFYFAFGFILTIVLISIVKHIFNPITKCIERFKPLIHNDETFNAMKGMDELAELEEIADILSLTFNNKIEDLIYHDDLTKLPNRKQMYKITNELINESKEFALIFIDLNKFKQINDLLGHLVGDELLKAFSNIIQIAVGCKGVVTRYSGDEFIIVYTDYTTDEELAKFYYDKVVPMFDEPIQIGNDNIIIEFSAGVSIYPKDGDSLDGLIRNSDFIMYKNKNTKNREKLLFFNDEVYKNIVRIETIKHELENCVKNDELILYYQPIVDKENVPRKIEVLLRWQNKKLGFVPPLDFISYAEETGDIVEIGYWIVEEVCRNYNELNYGLDNNLKVNINVSPIQLMKSDFVEIVKKTMDDFNVDYKVFCFEITESVVLDENSTVVDNLESLSKLGCQIALDDFGTGYSSFSYLKKFKLDTLKLDKMFITNASDIDYKIIENIKNIAEHLNMDVVIEGVEEQEQFNRLQHINCDLFQGYYFSKPLELEKVKEYLKNSNIIDK
ncbi:MAG: EAL domain-containing protein [Clostridium sp.]